MKSAMKSQEETKLFMDELTTLAMKHDMSSRQLAYTLWSLMGALIIDNLTDDE